MKKRVKIPPPFGKAISHVYVIEFQKRGLPHMHLLITLAKECRLFSPGEVDKIISAQLPDPEVFYRINFILTLLLKTDPELFDLVKRHMVHGPCGSRCMRENKKVYMIYLSKNVF